MPPPMTPKMAAPRTVGAITPAWERHAPYGMPSGPGLESEVHAVAPTMTYALVCQAKWAGAST